MRWLAFATLVLWQLTFAVVQPAIAAPRGFTELKIGDHAPDFDLPGVVRWVRTDGMGVQFRLLGVHETHAITEVTKD